MIGPRDVNQLIQKQPKEGFAWKIRAGQEPKDGRITITITGRYDDYPTNCKWLAAAVMAAFAGLNAPHDYDEHVALSKMADPEWEGNCSPAPLEFAYDLPRVRSRGDTNA